MLTNDDIKKLDTLFNTKLDEVSKAFDAKLDTKLDEVSKTFDTKLGKMSETFDEKLDRVVMLLDENLDAKLKPLKEDIEAIRETVQATAVAMDAQVKVNEDAKAERAAISGQLDRHEGWIKKLADKAQLKLEY